MLNINRLAKRALSSIGLDVRLVRNVRRAKRRASREWWAERFTLLRHYDIRSIIDVGANAGQFAKMIRQVLPDAPLYCFEPLSDCFHALEAAEKDLRPVQLFRIAAGDHEGSAFINRSAFTPSSSLLSMTERHAREWPQSAKSDREEIRVERLDTVLAQLNPEPNYLLKIDVQGYELNVITGAVATLQSTAVAVIEVSFVELYEGQALFDEVYERMRELGFTFAGVVEQYTGRDDGHNLFADALFVRDDLYAKAIRDCNES